MFGTVVSGIPDEPFEAVIEEARRKAGVETDSQLSAGDWKAVRQNLAKKAVKTELYDLKADPAESTDVAAKHPDVVKRLEAILKAQHTPSADFPLPGIDATR